MWQRCHSEQHGVRKSANPHRPQGIPAARAQAPEQAGALLPRVDPDTKAVLGDCPAIFLERPMRKLLLIAAAQRKEPAERLAASGAATVKEALIVISTPAQREPGDDTDLEEASKA